MELQPPILLHFAIYSTDTKIIQAIHSPSSLLYLTSSLPSHPPLPPPPTPHNRLTSPYSLPPILYEQLTLPEQLAIPPASNTPQAVYPLAPRPATSLLPLPPPHNLQASYPTSSAYFHFPSPHASNPTPHKRLISPEKYTMSNSLLPPPVSLIFFSPLIPHSGSLPTSFLIFPFSSSLFPPPP